MNQIQDKYKNLQQYLKRLGSVIVAFSGGVDSTFLLKVSHDVLRNNTIAVTARSLSFPKRELDEAKRFAVENDIMHIIIDSEELDIEDFSKNPPHRCYLCKSELFLKIKEVAEQKGIGTIVEGSNDDDKDDYRPGFLAITEHGIKSPLQEVNLTKAEIRMISKEIGLATWNKQPFACLSSRFPYGTEITPEKLHRIDRAEDLLLDMGCHKVRVRYHNNLARIETDEKSFNLIISKESRERIYEEFKALGFIYISIDLKGYRAGSMNETLDSFTIDQQKFTKF